MLSELESSFNWIETTYAANFERAKKEDLAITEGREETSLLRNRNIAHRPLDRVTAPYP